MCEQTTTTNHPIQLWVVFTWHKPFIILLCGQISLKTHQNGHIVGDNDGFKKFAQNPFGHGWKFSTPPFQTTWVVFPSGHSKHYA